LYNADMQSSIHKADDGAAADRLPFAAMAATAALVALASFLPGTRLWGCNHLAFYPVVVRVLALVLIGAAFIPKVADPLRRVLTERSEQLMQRNALRRAVTLAAAVISVGVFWLLSSSTLLLGDARLVASNFEHAFDPSYSVIVRSPRTIMLYEPIAKGASLIYHYAARASLELSGSSPLYGIRFVNCLLGGIFVFILLRRVLKRSSSGVLAAWTVSLVLGSGVMELYFGYVENYTPLIFFGSLYVLSALSYISSGSRSHIRTALVFLILTVFTHVQGVLLVPSFLLIMLLRRRTQGTVRPLRLTAVLFGLTAIGTYLFAVLTDYGRHFLPLLADDEVFGVLSPSHLADIANELVLIVPTILVAAGFALASGRLAGRQTGSRSAGRQQTPAGRYSVHFLLMVFLPCMIFLLAFKPDLGMARDWDLFAMAALGLIPLCLAAIGRAHNAGRSRQVERLTAPGVVTTAVLVLAWVGVNASPGLSARRFEAIMEYDLTRAPYAYEVLSQHYRDQGNLDRAIATIEKGMAMSYNTRLMALDADFHEESGNTEEAIRLRLEVLERQPDYEGPRRDLVLLLHRLGRYGDLLDISREGTRYHPESPVYHYFYGIALISAGRVERGIDELLVCKRLRPGDEVVASIDRTLNRLRAMGYDIEARDSATRFSIRER
jgi:hypothetical protein